MIVQGQRGLGQFVFGSGGGFDWGDYINRTTQQSLDILGARVGGPAYYQYGGQSRTPVAYPIQYPNQAGPLLPLSPGAVSQSGVQINWWTWALLGLLVGAFVLGRKR
jgi:hypothetical protein